MLSFTYGQSLIISRATISLLAVSSSLYQYQYHPCISISIILVLVSSLYQYQYHPCISISIILVLVSVSSLY